MTLINRRNDNFRKGVEFETRILTDINSVNNADSYYDAVDTEIKKCVEGINNYSGSKMGIPQLAGYVAEETVAGTYNIDAAMNGSGNRAWTLQSNDRASVDIVTNQGRQYSLKFYSTPAGNFNAQAENWIQRYQETTMSEPFVDYCVRNGLPVKEALYYYSVYEGYDRLIPSDQLKDAIEYGMKKINTAKLQALTKEDKITVRGLEETLDKLCATISDGENSSQPLTKEQAETIAEIIKKRRVTPDDITRIFDNEIKFRHVMKESVNAATSAMIMSAIMTLLPEIYKLIDKLIKDGEIDIDVLRESGKVVISNSGESFLRGGLAAALTIYSRAGYFGKTMEGMDASAIGSMVVLLIETVKDGIAVARGDLTKQEMVFSISKKAFIMASAWGFGKASQAAFPEAPGIAFMVGSFLGSVVGSIGVVLGENCLIGLCVDHGFTCFGLVDQDYSFPEEYLRDIGIDLCGCEIYSVDECGCYECGIEEYGCDECGMDTINFKFLRRGLVGVNKVGYVYG